MYRQVSFNFLVRIEYVFRSRKVINYRYGYQYFQRVRFKFKDKVENEVGKGQRVLVIEVFQYFDCSMFYQSGEVCFIFKNYKNYIIEILGVLKVFFR